MESLGAVWNAFLIPGVELTNNTSRYHILALDIKEYISPDFPVEEIVEYIRRQQGVSMACHPYIRNHSGDDPSFYLWENHERLVTLFDAWEVANRDDLFNVVGLKKSITWPVPIFTKNAICTHGKRCCSARKMSSRSRRPSARTTGCRFFCIGAGR